MDSLPTVDLDGTIIQLDRPLAWYEYVWMGIPVVLVFAAGVFGALFGLSATYFSSRISRSERTLQAKYALSGLVSIAAVGAFVAGIVGIQVAVLSFRDPASMEALAEVAEISNRDLPTMVHEATELEGLDGVLVFHSRLPAIAPDEVDRLAFLERIRPVAVNQICADSELPTRFLDEGVRLRYSYAASHRKKSAALEVGSADGR